jgi:hypothetical protein
VKTTFDDKCGSNHRERLRTVLKKMSYGHRLRVATWKVDIKAVKKARLVEQDSTGGSRKGPGGGLASGTEGRWMKPQWNQERVMTTHPIVTLFEHRPLQACRTLVFLAPDFYRSIKCRRF